MGDKRQERTYQEDEYVDIGEEIARSWREIEDWKLSQQVVARDTTREVPNAQDCPPNAIGRTNPTIGDIMNNRGGRKIGGE